MSVRATPYIRHYIQWFKLLLAVLTSSWFDLYIGFVTEPELLYCFTPALDGYVILPDRTPHTLGQWHHSICGMAFYNLHHPHLYLLLFTSVHPICFHLDCFHPSWLPADKACPQLITKSLAIIHRSCNLSPTCGTYHCGWNVENTVEKTDNRDTKGAKVPLRDNRGATCGKLYLRCLIRLV